MAKKEMICPSKRDMAASVAGCAGRTNYDVPAIDCIETLDPYAPTCAGTEN